MLDRLDRLVYDVEDAHTLLLAHHKNIGLCQDQIGLISNVLCRYEDRIEELSNKVTALEAKTMKNEIIIFGIIEEEGKTPLEQAEAFLKNTMQIASPLSIATAYWKGKTTHKPMVIKFTSPNAKSVVFSNVSKLKGVKNANNKYY